MTMLRLTPAILTLGLAAGHPQLLRAQGIADTTGIARAIATTIADSILTPLRGSGHLVLEPGSPITAEVVTHLQGQELLQGPVPRPAEERWLTIVTIEIGPDTAEALIEIGEGFTVDGERKSDLYRTPFIYARTSTGWVLVRHGLTRQFYAGAVRRE